MRPLLIAVLALCTSLTTIATAQPETAAAPPFDAKMIDPSNVNFVLAERGCVDEPTYAVSATQVYGVVAGTLSEEVAGGRHMRGTNVDLGDTRVAKQLLMMGLRFGHQKCPASPSISVALTFGNPATFGTADVTPLFGRLSYYTEASGMWQDMVLGGWNKNSPGMISNYSNHAISKEDFLFQKTQLAAMTEARDRQKQDQQRETEDAASFVQRSGARFVSTQELRANPFVFKGKVVAVHAVFKRMASETQAVFY